VIPQLEHAKTRWLTLALVFGIGPLIVHGLVLNPPLRRISEFCDRFKMSPAAMPLLVIGRMNASNRELAQLEEIKTEELGKYKKVDSIESLMRFSGALADALAEEARSLGLRVMEVNLQNVSIRAKYRPQNNAALEALDSLPGLQWSDLKDPLILPMLKLPSIELEMTVTAEYSKVFSFIESLANFPVPVSLASLEIVEDPRAQAFRLKIRGYYYGKGKMSQHEQAAAENR
jgi:hypothetical protein